MLYIGIDLGTSACKLLLADEAGQVRNAVTKEYPLSFPYPGWSEQEPAHWWAAVLGGVPELLVGFDARSVKGIGIGGLPQQCGRQRESVRTHCQYRLCRLYCSEAVVDALQRTGPIHKN